MSRSANSQVCAVVEGSGVYDLQRRRDALPYIFEDVDVVVLMKRLDVNAAGKISCTPRGTASSTRGLPSASDFAASSAVSTNVSDLVGKCSDAALSVQSHCECQQVRRPGHHHNDTLANTPYTATSSRSCHGEPDGIGFVSSSSNDNFQIDGSTTSCMVPVSEREKNISRSSSACSELSDNCHAVVGFRPEDCAKRSLIF